MLRRRGRVLPMRWKVFTVVLVTLALVTSACREPLTEASTGAEVFTHSCAQCHGASLQGRNPAPRLAGSDAPSADKPRDFFVNTVTRGRNRMPSFGTQLSDEHIGRVVDFVMASQGR
jgi:mono/diheme cytochrome c family protein